MSHADTKHLFSLYETETKIQLAQRFFTFLKMSGHNGAVFQY